MRVMVTGDLGFIGGELKSKLIELGHDVIGLDKWIFTNYNRTRIPFDTFGRMDAIFHLGAISNTLTNDLDKTMRFNTLMTADLAEFCEREEIPLIYSSSASVYGNSYPDISPQNLYAWSKYLGERYVTAVGGVSLRYFNVFGKSEYKKLNMASVATQAFLRFRNSKRPFHLFPGKPKRDFIHVSDVVQANLDAWQLAKIPGIDRSLQFDVGSAESMTFEEVLDLMEVPYIYTASDSVPAGYQLETKARKDRWIPNWKPALPNREQFLIHRNDLLLLTSNRF